MRDDEGNAIQRVLIKFVHDDNCDLEFQYYLPEDGDMELCYTTVTSGNATAYYSYDNGEKFFMYYDELTYDEEGNVTYKERYQKIDDDVELSFDNLYVTDTWEYGYDTKGRPSYYVYSNYSSADDEYPYLEHSEFYHYVGDTDNFYQTEKLVIYYEEDEGYPTTEYERLYFVVQGSISEENFYNIDTFEEKRFELLKKITAFAGKYNMDGADYAMYVILGTQYDETLCLDENLDVFSDLERRLDKAIIQYKLLAIKEDSEILKDEVSEILEDGSLLFNVKKAINFIAENVGKTISSINLNNIFNFFTTFFAKIFCYNGG